MADIKISELPAGDALAGTEVLPAVQDGGTVKVTAAQIAAYVLGTADDGVSIVTVSTTTIMDPATHGGRGKLILASDDCMFDSAETYAAGMVFNIRATAAMELLEDGVTLTPPAGGTLDLDADMAVSVIMTGATTGVVIGQTVAA